MECGSLVPPEENDEEFLNVTIDVPTNNNVIGTHTIKLWIMSEQAWEEKLPLCEFNLTLKVNAEGTGDGGCGSGGNGGGSNSQGSGSNFLPGFEAVFILIGISIFILIFRKPKVINAKK